MHDGGWWAFIRYDEKTDKPRISRPLLRRALEYARPYRGMIIAMLALLVAITLLNLIPPLLTRNLIDQALPNKDLRQLTLLALGMLAVPVLTGLLGVAQRYFSATVGEGIISDLRTALFSHLHSM